MNKPGEKTWADVKPLRATHTFDPATNSGRLTLNLRITAESIRAAKEAIHRPAPNKTPSSKIKDTAAS